MKRSLPQTGPLHYSAVGMPEGEVVHYYNVITGHIACGCNLVPNRTVFPISVTCPECLKSLQARTNSAAKKQKKQAA